MSDDLTIIKPAGVDASHWQPGIEWNKVAGAGKKFAICKATQGNYYRDSEFHRNRYWAKQNGILFGAYHFFDPRIDPVAQAAYFCNMVGGIPTGELQPALDFESLGNKNGLVGRPVNKDKAIHDAVVWLTEVQNRTGRTPIIYSYEDFIRTDLGNTQRFCKDFALWIARYGAAPSNPLPGGWAFYTFWQTTSTGRCPGIGAGRVNADLDVFNGSMDALKKFAGL